VKLLTGHGILPDRLADPFGARRLFKTSDVGEDVRLNGVGVEVDGVTDLKEIKGFLSFPRIA
jgi:hypothetical protein